MDWIPDAWRWRDVEGGRDVLSAQGVAGEVEGEAVDEQVEEQQLPDRLSGVDGNLGR